MLTIKEKTREQLASEGAELRQRVTELKTLDTVHKQVGRPLGKAEEDKLAILNSISELVILQDMEHRAVWANKAAGKSVNLPARQLVGRHCYEIWHQQSQPCDGCPVVKARQTGKPQKAEITTPDGRTWSVRGYPVLGENDRVTGILEVVLDITEREQAEEALQAEKNKLQSVIDALEDDLSIQDKHHNITYQNKPSIINFGDHLGEKCYRAFEGRDKVCPGCPVEKAFKDGKSHISERKTVTLSGEVIYLENTANLIRNASGEIVACLEVGRNITERKQADEKLQTILKTAHDGFWLTNLEGKLLEVNDSYCKMVGYTREELLKMFIWDLEALEGPEEVAQRIKKIIEQGYDSFESQHKRKDGKIIDVEVSVNYLDVDEGQFFVFTRDITERKQMEEELRTSQEKLERMFESVTDGISVISLNGVITEANQRTVEMHGFGSKNELLGKSAFDLVAPSDHEKIAKNMRKTLKQGIVRDAEYTLLKSDGSKFPGELSSSVLKDASGNPVGHITIARDITERKQVEKALKESEEKYKELAESITDVFFAFDKDLRYTYWNKASEELTGISAKDALGKHLYDIFPNSELTRRAEKVYLKALKTQQVHSFVNEYQLGDEDYFFEISAYPSKNGLSVFTRDITERKKAEEALGESQKFSSSLLANSPNPMLVINQDTSVRYVNPALEKLSGFSSAEVTGRKAPYSWWTEETLKKTTKDLEQSMHKGAIGLEELFQKKNGERFWVEITSTPVTSNGEFKYYLANWVDITERKKAEEALKESQKFSSSLLENSPNPIFVLNPDTSIKYVNPAFEKLTSFTLAEITSLKVPHPWWPEEYSQDMMAGLKEAMAIGGRRSQRIFQKKNGERFWVELNSASVVHQGKLIYFLISWVDITERKQAEERERELQQELHLSSRLAAIGELAAGVAHQINNPLTGVLGFSQRLLRKSTDNEVSQDLKKIYTEAERAAKVVQNLLTFARRRQPHKQYSDINEIVQSALELQTYELKTSNIEVVTDLAPLLPQIMLDFHQIQEVFLNIILNAEQAITEAHNGGKLTIKTEERKGYIRATFTDDGPGIPAEHLDKIFDPFFTTKGEKDGTGLGLSVCHGIITEHSGRIYAKSKPGKGATFFIELPLPANTSQEVATPSGQQVVPKMD